MKVDKAIFVSKSIFVDCCLFWSARFCSANLISLLFICQTEDKPSCPSVSMMTGCLSLSLQSHVGFLIRTYPLQPPSLTLPAHHPSAGGPARSAPCEPLAREGWAHLKERALCLDRKGEGQERGLSRLEYLNPICILATSSQARKNSVIRYDGLPSRDHKFQPCAGKKIGSAGRVHWLWSLQRETRVGLIL